MSSESGLILSIRVLPARLGQQQQENKYQENSDYRLEAGAAPRASVLCKMIDGEKNVCAGQESV